MKCDNFECSKPFPYDEDMGRHRCFSVSWGDFCSEPCATRVRQEDYDAKLKRNREKANQVLHPSSLPQVSEGADGAQDGGMRDVPNHNVQNVPRNKSRRRPGAN